MSFDVEVPTSLRQCGLGFGPGSVEGVGLDSDEMPGLDPLAEGPTPAAALRALAAKLRGE